MNPANRMDGDVQYMNVAHSNNDNVQYMNLANGIDNGVQYMNLASSNNDNVQYMNIPYRANDGVQYINHLNTNKNDVQYMNVSKPIALCNDDESDVEHQRKSGQLVSICINILTTS